MAVLITAVNATAQLASVVNSSLPLPEPLLPSNPLGPSINTMTLYSLLITTLLVAAANVLATAGGIGGGGFLVPILTAVMEIHDAVPLSKALIFAANLVVLVGNWNVVDFEAAAMMQPASLAGTIVGVYVNRAAPAWLLLLLLATVLSFTTWRTLSKALIMWRKETAMAAANPNHLASPVVIVDGYSRIATDEPEPSLELLHDDDRTLTEGSTTASPKVKEAQLVTLAEDEDLLLHVPVASSGSAGHGHPNGAAPAPAQQLQLSTPRKQPQQPPPMTAAASAIPVRTSTSLSSQSNSFEDTNSPYQFQPPPPSEENGLYYAAIVVTFLTLVTCSIGKSFLDPSSAGVHLLALTPLPVAVIVASLVLSLVLSRDRQRDPEHQKWLPGNRHVLTLVASFLSGIGASSLGVGGGIFFGPLLLEISGPNPDPVRTSALSSTLVLFTAASSTVQYAVLGKLHWVLAAWYSVFMIASGILGQWSTKRIIRMFGRKSVIVICLGVGLGVSAVMALEQMGNSVWRWH